MQTVSFEPIGVVRSPFAQLDGMPIQPIGARGVKGSVELNPELEQGLKDLCKFSHIILLYYFHLSEGYSLHVVPFLDKFPRGVFSTRVPRRPNGIGLSIVTLLGVHGNVIEIGEVDIVDGTPLLDIKPFVPQFDNRSTANNGWYAQRVEDASELRSDKRFVTP